MRDFEYEAPETLSELTELLAAHQGRARLLAGGTDLIDHVRSGRLSPDCVIDVKRIPQLNELTLADSELIVGAAVPCYRIYEHPEIGTHFAALVDSTRIIGGIQIQNRATLGGNLCNSSPAADSIPAMIALSGTADLQGPGGERSVAVEDFCTGPGTNILQPASGGTVEGPEAVVSLRFPRPAPRFGSHYRRFIPRNEMDIAVVGVGAGVQLSEDGTQFDNVRLALAAVAATPLLVEEIANELIGCEVQAGIDRAVQIARSVASPIDDMRGTRDFRLHVVGVLVERVLKMAVDRALASMQV